MSMFFGKRPREDFSAGETALKAYELGDILGEGAFAVVRLAIRKRDDCRLAIKMIDRSRTASDDAEHELKVLSTIGLHRHIVSLIEHFELPDSKAVVMELAEGGEVFEKICEGGPYSEADAASVIRQVALALAFMHSVGVVHRDLKPENLLLTSSNDVKVADFGLAAFCGDEHPPLTQMCGTATYLAPELIAAADAGGKPYGVAVDLFSLGGVMFALLGGYVAFDPGSNLDDPDVVERISKNQWGFDDFPQQWTHVSEGAKGLIRSLLEPDPAKRITADAVLLTQWASGEGVSGTPLPGSESRLKGFNGGRQVWRAAIHAASIFAKGPLAAAHHAETKPGKAGGKGKGKVASTGNKQKSLPPMVISELKSSFELFDLDGNGRIDDDEMRQAVRSIGMKEADAAAILKSADKDGDGLICFDEFVTLVRPVYDDTGVALRNAFDMFDADGSGFIDRSELSVMLRKLGFAWQGSHVFESADSDGDGKVSYEEFIGLFGKAVGGKAKKGGASSS